MSICVRSLPEELVRFSRKYSYKYDSILEIGSFRGESASIFATYFKKVICVDPWMTGYDDTDPASSDDMIDVEDQFDKVMYKFSNIEKMKMTSSDAVNLFEDKSLDIVYVDGCHTYDAVVEDLNLWIPKIKNGGVISGHDYWIGYECQVVNAIHDTIGKPDEVYRDSSWVKYIK